jgi:hypothetical protein
MALQGKLQSFGALIIGDITCKLNKSSRRLIMLKFITNLFGTKNAEPVAPYKVEAPAFPVQETPVVNSSAPVVNGRKAPAAKPKAATVTGNKPPATGKKKVSSGANKKPQPKK